LVGNSVALINFDKLRCRKAGISALVSLPARLNRILANLINTIIPPLIVDIGIDIGIRT